MKESKNNQDDKTLLERHALGRLDKVETDKRKAYDKKKGHVHVQQIIMVIIFVFILTTMIIAMSNH
ncbi:hypothetical protein [Lactobacillus crispatus]|uniref:Uncharacterized protein n=1 Tax=Lactobacillus crispatus TaxID=47770 RepID=A0A7H9E6K0_9LACO|nr:hypothetical protein [Lactobacillus crispatus]QLL73250.1 hypothetical protein GTO85_01920 [Lactobacillus crispatus]